MSLKISCTKVQPAVFLILADFDNCISSPCLNGKCRDALDGYECECYSGFVGTECSINIDDCVNNVCMEGSTCIDGVDKYTCICPQDMTGLLCEIKMGKMFIFYSYF